MTSTASGNQGEPAVQSLITFTVLTDSGQKPRGVSLMQNSNWSTRGTRFNNYS
jgi:hypothetical protein